MHHIRIECFEMIWKWTDEGSLCRRILMLELPSRRSRGQAFFEQVRTDRIMMLLP